MDRLFIRKCGLAARAPIYDVISTVYKPLVVQTDEYLANGIGQPFVHGKPRPCPITGTPQFLKLHYYSTAIFFSPCPHLFQKFFSTYILPLYTITGKFPFHDILCSNP